MWEQQLAHLSHPWKRERAISGFYNHQALRGGFFYINLAGMT